jgi:zeta-carotene desaturase
MYAEPARAYLERRGGSVRCGAPATVQIERGEVRSVTVDGSRWQARSVIAAVPWFAVGDLFQGDTAPLEPMLSRARAMRSSPIVTVNLWFDRPLFDEPFLGLPGRAMQWVFDKRAAFGERASHLSLVSSGASPLVGRSNPELIAEAEAELMAAIPQARAAKLLRATVIREPRATFSLAPGEPARPDTATPIRALYLAGDWVATDLPATIESAVRSGHRAAAAANLRDWDSV